MSFSTQICMESPNPHLQYQMEPPNPLSGSSIGNGIQFVRKSDCHMAAYAPFSITTALGYLETAPVASQVMPVPVRPSKVMLVNWVLSASQISLASMSPFTPEARTAS